MIEIQGLVRRYGDVEAVSGLTLAIPGGQGSGRIGGWCVRRGRLRRSRLPIFGLVLLRANVKPIDLVKERGALHPAQTTCGIGLIACVGPECFQNS